jgi:hypothetical protein
MLLILNVCIPYTVKNNWSGKVFVLASEIKVSPKKSIMDAIPVRLPHDLQNRVEAISKELSISRSAVVRLAIQQWLDAAEIRGLNPILREEIEVKPSLEEKAAPPKKPIKRGSSGS